MPTFALIADRVAIKLDDPESKSQGGIVIPDNAKEKSTKGTVVAVGPGKWSERNNKHTPMSVKVGDRVLVDKYGHTKAEIEGEDFTIMREEDVIALLASSNGKAKKK
jgi:chaperonin GroES